MTVQTIGIAGITGKFALCVLNHLLQIPFISIRGYCRNPNKLPQKLLSSPRIRITQGDSTNDAALRAFAKGCDVVICCYLGDNALMTDGQMKLIDACESEGVPRYIASDYTLDYRKLEYGQLPPKDPMKYVQKYLEAKKGVAAVHVLIGAFMETFFSAYFGIFDPESRSFAFWGTGDEVWESTTYDNAAEFVAAVAMDETATGFQRFVGDRKSIKQIAETSEDVYGEKPALKPLGSLFGLHKRMHQVRDENPENTYAYLAMFYQFHCINGQTYIHKDEEASKYPNIPHTTFKDFFKQHPIDSLHTASGRVGSNFDFKC